MQLAPSCASEFASQIRSRGERYFREGRVSIKARGAHEVDAIVEGSGEDYTVSLEWDDSSSELVSLTASCTCPHFADGFLCKHVWATMLEVDSSGEWDDSDGDREWATWQNGSPRVEFPEDDEDADEDSDFGANHSRIPDEIKELLRNKMARKSSSRSRRSSRRGAESKRGASKKKVDWRHQLKSVDSKAFAQRPLQHRLDLKHREAWFLLDVSNCQQKKTLIISLFQREAKKNGELGKLKALTLNRGSIKLFPQPEDRELLSLLLDSHNRSDEERGFGSYYSYYGHQRSDFQEIQPIEAVWEMLVPKLAAHERFRWMLSSDQPIEEARPIVWDDGAPWRFRLLVEADDKQQQWLLSGQWVHPDRSEPVPLQDAVWTIPQGLVLFEDRMARHESSDFAPWISALNSAGSIRVPYKDRPEFQKYLWKLPQRLEAILPDNLRWSEVALAPRGFLRIQKPSRPKSMFELQGNVFFRYEDRDVSLKTSASGVLDEERQRVLVRDLEAEKRLLEEVRGSGVLPINQTGFWSYDDSGDVRIPKDKLFQIVERLVQSGWDVEAEGQMVRRPGAVQMSVRSDVDWFELSGEFDFDGVPVHLPDLLVALRKREKFVTLGDGSRGLLPEEWLQQFGPIAELGEANGETIRFQPSQAMLLDTLLAAQPKVSVDRQFTRYRKKLQSFDGIKPRSEPRGFQGSLRDYQKEGLGWLRFLDEYGFGGCLADDMGLGKTVQVLALLEARRTRRLKQGETRLPTLVVVPRSLVFNWLEEASRFTPKLRVLNYTGKERSSYLEQLSDYHLLVTTYGTLKRDAAKLKNVSFDYVILDESQAIKNADSQNAKACRLLQARRRLAMTGTPIENHLGELWSLFEFLNPGMLGRSSAFQALVKQPVGEADSTKFLSRAVAPFLLRRTKEEVLTELPSKTEQTLHCELEPRERKRYNQLRDFYRAKLTKTMQDKGLAQSKFHVLEALLRLRQAACHPGLLDRSQANERSAKLALLLDHVAEVIGEGHKALIFSQFTSFLSIVKTHLDERGISYEYLDGKTRNREERIRKFQEGSDCQLFLISLKAGGFGLNLTAADYVFILDPWWNPAAESQAIDRTHRIGQTQRVFAYRLIASGTVEDRILELQASKRELADSIVSNNSSLIRQLTADDLQLLLT